MNKNYQFIDEIYQQTNNMLENILISIILYNFGIPLLVPYTKDFGRITQF